MARRTHRHRAPARERRSAGAVCWAGGAQRQDARRGVRVGAAPRGEGVHDGDGRQLRQRYSQGLAQVALPRPERDTLDGALAQAQPERFSARAAAPAPNDVGAWADEYRLGEAWPVWIETPDRRAD